MQLFQGSEGNRHAKLVLMQTICGFLPISRSGEPAGRRHWWTPLVCLALSTSMPAYPEEIVLGMSAAFTGPVRSLGIELYRGSVAYLDEVNRRGGVHGREVVVRAYDDGYEPGRAIQNTLRLVEQDDVFALFDYVGTPTVTRVLPLLSHYSDRHLLMLFPFTGAEPQRRAPYVDHVFNLRASYREETAALVRHFLDTGRRRVAVLYQADAYGRGGWEGVRLALREADSDVHAEATYRRGTGFDADFTAQVDILRGSGADAVVAVCTYKACAGFIRDARDADWQVPIAHLSFSGSEAMADLLQRAGDASAHAYDRNLIVSQVVPSYQDVGLPAVRAYRELMDRLGARVPEGVESEDYIPEPYSFASFEGFLNARLVVLALQALGPNPRRKELRQAIEGLGEVDLGIDTPVAFRRGRHQGMEAVFLTTLSEGNFDPVAVGTAKAAALP